MNKLKLAAVAIAAFVAADFIATTRANAQIRRADASFNNEAQDIALRYFALGVECGRADTQYDNDSKTDSSRTDTPAQES